MKLKITIDSKVYEVEIEAEDSEPVRSGSPAVYAPARVAAPVAAAAPPPPPAAASNGGGPVVADEGKACRSPIVGIVVSVNAQEGQEVQQNDPVLVLEAMKMETTITSPVSGRVKKVHVASGDSVQVNQVLIEFE